MVRWKTLALASLALPLLLAATERPLSSNEVSFTRSPPPPYLPTKTDQDKFERAFVVVCRIIESGRLGACRPEKGGRVGADDAAWAVGWISTWRVSLKARDGTFTHGRSIRIPIRLRTDPYSAA